MQLPKYGIINKNHPLHRLSEVQPEDSASQPSLLSSSNSTLSNNSAVSQNIDQWKHDFYDKVLLATVSANLPFMWIENPEVKDMLLHLNSHIKVHG